MQREELGGIGMYLLAGDHAETSGDPVLFLAKIYNEQRERERERERPL